MQLDPNLPGLAGAIFPIGVCGDEATPTLDECVWSALRYGHCSYRENTFRYWLGRIRLFLDTVVA
jgi:hypothetical protein